MEDSCIIEPIDQIWQISSKLVKTGQIGQKSIKMVILTKSGFSKIHTIFLTYPPSLFPATFTHPLPFPILSPNQKNPGITFFPHQTVENDSSLFNYPIIPS
jgi:hypothetical protein